MRIPNTPSELDLTPLLEHLSKLSEKSTGVPRERCRPMHHRQLYWFFLEDRDTYEQKEVDELVEYLQLLYNGDLPR